MVTPQERVTAPSATATERAFEENNRSLASYYRLHAKVYDRTRWSFLFGRTAIVDAVAQCQQPQRILEVGCGTGKNLITLHRRFPQAHITGLDLSSHMLRAAHKNITSLGGQVTLQQGAYGVVPQSQQVDLILFSYALTMFNPGWDAAIEQAHRDLAPGGAIAVVDFHNSPWPLFKRWMGANHVRMDGHLLLELQQHFVPRRAEVKSAYGGIWSYLLFVGGK